MSLGLTTVTFLGRLRPFARRARVAHEITVVADHAGASNSLPALGGWQLEQAHRHDLDPNLIDDPTPKRYRAIFLSDIHLGTRTSQAESLLEFLRKHDADTIYLVGDIIDFWRVRRGPHWPQTHNDVVQKLLRKVRKGSRIVFVPGNHDECLRDFRGMHFGGIDIVLGCIHQTATGKRYVVLHGDEFDLIVRTAKWLAFLGDRGYETALWLNNPLNWVRRHLGLGYWSLSAFLKHGVKRAVSFISAFEDAVAAEARRQGADGIICGHIHTAADRMIGPVHYMNCGDWVESHTAIVETMEGELRLIHWPPTITAARGIEVKAPKVMELT
jgi:UDP-2,3-diacylglucosamine pyrophosphatase LpxH